MKDALSLWRSPIDEVAIAAAHELAARQPRCDYPINLAPVLASPGLPDTVPIYHAADGKGYQVSLATLASVIGSVTTFAYNADLTGLTIYNYGFYTGTPNLAAAPNAAAMTAMLNDMSNANPQGGEAWIPQYSYAITPGNFNVPTGVNMRALGTGGAGFGMSSLDHFLIQGDGTLFNCAGVGGHTLGGIRFENLGIGYSSNSPATLGTSTAIIANASNTKVVKCGFTNCPTVAILEGLSCGLEQCTIYYNAGPDGTGPNAAGQFAAVVLQAPEVYIVGPGEIFQSAQGDPPAPAKTNGIAISGSSENAIVQNLHIQHWSYGITFNLQKIGGGGTGAKWPKIVNCEIASWITPVFMQMSGDPTMGYAPGTSNGVVWGAKFTSCNISLDPGDTGPGTIPNTNTTPLVLIDTNATGNNSNIADVEFTNCSVYGGNQYGYQIVAGSDIRLNGGMCSGNGNMTTNGGNPGAGIAITGACGAVLVQGVNLNPKFNGSSSPAQAQTYAVLVTASLTSSVTIDNCDMAAAGYTGSPISVTALQPAGKFVVRNCPGYNDQNTVINTVANIVAATTYSAATAGASGGTNYWGPSFLIVGGLTGGSTVSINGGPNIALASSTTLFLNSPYDTFRFSVAPASLYWIGK